MTLVGYAFLSSMIFAIVAALQLIRAIGGWPITINTVNIPVAASWIAFLVTAVLSYLGFSAARGTGLKL